MNADRTAALKELLRLVAPLIPGAGPYFAAAQAVWPSVKALFVREGGDPAEFDAIMASVRADIDKLANPDQFFEGGG